MDIADSENFGLCSCVGTPADGAAKAHTAYTIGSMHALRHRVYAETA